MVLNSVSTQGNTEELGFVTGLHLYFCLDGQRVSRPLPKADQSQSASPVGMYVQWLPSMGFTEAAQSWPSSPILSDWVLYSVFSCTSAPVHHLLSSPSFACEDLPFYILFNIHIYSKLINISVLLIYRDGVDNLMS